MSKNDLMWLCLLGFVLILFNLGGDMTVKINDMNITGSLGGVIIVLSIVLFFYYRKHKKE
jgi:hypothetical protein